MPGLSLTYISTAFAAAVSVLAHAQNAATHAFPVRPVRLVVAQAAGGPTDVVARIFAYRLSEILGQQAVVDNRYGAGGSIAGEITARAPADGYTLMIAANGTLAIAPHMIKLSYDARRDLAPVALIGNSPLGLMVSPTLAATSVKELIAFAKARPGTLNFGSSQTGATSHLASEMLKMMAGINIVHVPYKGAGPALIGVMSGEIDMLISGLSSGLPYIRQKQVRLLAVSSARRVPSLPEVPSIAETLPGYDVSSWYAIFGPAGTPRAIVEQLNRATATVLAMPDVQAKLVAAGVDVEILSPQQLAAKLSADLDRWGKVIKAAGIKAN